MRRVPLDSCRLRQAAGLAADGLRAARRRRDRGHQHLRCWAGPLPHRRGMGMPLVEVDRPDRAARRPPGGLPRRGPRSHRRAINQFHAVAATAPPTTRCGPSSCPDAPVTSAPSPTSRAGPPKDLHPRDLPLPQLKRYIAREVHRANTRPLPLAPHPHHAPRPAHPGRSPASHRRPTVRDHRPTALRIERGLTRVPAIQIQIHAWLTATGTIQIAA
jgi:hypothetical protein